MTLGTQPAFTLRLYIAGQTVKSVTALANLKKLMDELAPGQYEIEVVDLVEHPERAEMDQIVAIPTLIRRLPEPVMRILGDLSKRDRVLKGLELDPR